MNLHLYQKWGKVPEGHILQEKWERSFLLVEVKSVINVEAASPPPVTHLASITGLLSV